MTRQEDVGKRLARCDDCRRICPEDDLAKSLWQVDGLSERLDPGGEVPAGECECGALAYLYPNDSDETP